MKTITKQQGQAVQVKLNNQHFNNITDFYDNATADYVFWSKHMNMHYGFMKSLKQIFNREAMLEQMNLEVFQRLDLPTNAHVLDAGCGTGASCRALVQANKHAQVTGINIVKSHIETGKKLNREIEGSDRIKMLLADYHKVPLPNNVADGIYGMESICHSHNKAQWMQEMHRLLKPGGKMVITDCFLRNPSKPMRKLSRWAYNQLRTCWSVPHLAEIKLFESMLIETGFKNVQIEDVRWKVAPSVMHSPAIVLRFLWHNLIRGKKTGGSSRKNLMAVLMSIIMGLDTRSVSYYIVTAEKD